MRSSLSFLFGARRRRTPTGHDSCAGRRRIDSRRRALCFISERATGSWEGAGGGGGGAYRDGGVEPSVTFRSVAGPSAFAVGVPRDVTEPADLRDAVELASVAARHRVVDEDEHAREGEQHRDHHAELRIIVMAL